MIRATLSLNIYIALIFSTLVWNACETPQPSPPHNDRCSQGESCDIKDLTGDQDAEDYLIDRGPASMYESPDFAEPEQMLDARLENQVDMELIDQGLIDQGLTDQGLVDQEYSDQGTIDQGIHDLGPILSCDDQVLNGTETDIDCGGDCTSCLAGQSCLSFRDCTSHICGGGQCLEASCVDRVLNGNESDLDCGGDCNGCTPGKLCREDHDCDGSLCSEGQCALPQCGDSVISTEEDCDDGHTITEACPYGESSCLVCAADCKERAGETHLCGDSELDPQEECDHGTSPNHECIYGEVSCQVCGFDCQWAPGNVRICGDGILNHADGEECDDGNDVPNDGCEADCTVTTGVAFFRDHVQTILVDRCSSCHLGERFGFTSLMRSGEDFTEADTLKNYEAFFDLISLDAPSQSRLLTKVIPQESTGSVDHAGGRLIELNDSDYQQILQWIELEKSLRCPDCGLASTNQYLAYVDAPNLYWALDRSPSRRDHGLRNGQARIMLQAINQENFEPEGDPIDFLNGALCNEAGECDFGHLAVNHAGNQMVFECRIPVQEGDDWLNDVNWNICIAEIGTDGRAINPRFLMPEERRHRRQTYARSSPFALFTPEGLPLKGVYDKHFRVRRSDDSTPTFSPDDQRIILSSRGPDPRTGHRMTRTYHGFQFADNIISVALDGSDPKTVYLNEGGTADSPFFLKDGDLAVHVWNLERMDRHLYIRTTPDGMMEQPTLFGRLQGVNMWGKATQLTNGLILGLTGRRRGAVSLWQPFIADHTLGTGIEDGLTSFALIDPETDTHDSHFSYCRQPPAGTNCTVPRFYLDPTYSPDGRAFVALNPELTYVTQGDSMYGMYSQGNNTEERLASLAPYLPQSMGIWLLDHRGNREPFIEPQTGRMLRFPAWVGKRQAERILPTVSDETLDWSELHIAHVPLWLSFRHNSNQDKTRLFERLDEITKLRVLVKVGHGNDCMNDGRAYRNAVHNTYDHPTHLGINNSTGYERLFVPLEAGGDQWGDIPLQADASVRIRLPARELLLFQGINDEGRVITQHSRVFAMPPGHQVNTGVPREQYQSQCSSCHGSIDDIPFKGLQQMDQLAAEAINFNTEAMTNPVIDLTASEVIRQSMTFVDQVRPILDNHCVSCHTGTTPAGELSFAAEYSATANYPAGSRASLLSETFLNFVPEEARVPGYDFSVPYSWYMRDGNREYREHEEYASLVASHSPLAELAPWDPAYQNLMVFDQSSYRYLGGDGYASHYGRADVIGGNSQNAWLIEILTGEDLDPQRNFEGLDHSQILVESQVRTLRAVMDLGFPYTARCDDRIIPSGPNEGLPWGDPVAIPY